jgi:hypothetical protein
MSSGRRPPQGLTQAFISRQQPPQGGGTLIAPAGLDRSQTEPPPLSASPDERHPTTATDHDSRPISSKAEV